MIFSKIENFYQKLISDIIDIWISSKRRMKIHIGERIISEYDVEQIDIICFDKKISYNFLTMISDEKGNTEPDVTTQKIVHIRNLLSKEREYYILNHDDDEEIVETPVSFEDIKITAMDIEYVIISSHTKEIIYDCSTDIITKTPKSTINNNSAVVPHTFNTFLKRLQIAIMNFIYNLCTFFAVSLMIVLAFKHKEKILNLMYQKEYTNIFNTFTN